MYIYIYRERDETTYNMAMPVKTDLSNSCRAEKEQGEGEYYN
jgi:hypothetical protein